MLCSMRAAITIEEINGKLIDALKGETGSAQIINDISEHAYNLIQKGTTSFTEFNAAMKERFAAVWDKIKQYMRDLFSYVSNERGSVRNPFGTENQPEASPEIKKQQEAAAPTYLSRLMEDPLYKQYTGKMEQTNGGLNFKELKKHSDLFNWYNEKFGKGYIDDDMKWFGRAFDTPYGLAKRFASMAKAMDTELTAAEVRSKMIFDDWNGNLGKIAESAAKDKALLDEIRKIIWKFEGKEIKEVKSKWYKKWKAGEDIEANPKHYEELENYLVGMGYSQRAVDGYVGIRKMLDQKRIDIDKLYRSLENPDPNMIEEYRTAIGTIHNYFPHRRTGDSYIQITDRDGNVVYREHYNSANKFKNRPPQVRQRTAEWLQNAIATGELTGSVSDYTIQNPAKVTSLPDETFFQISTEALHQIAKAAGERMEGTEKEKADISRMLAKAMAETIQSRGWGRHAIPRKGTPGHETQDVFGILFDYASGFAGFATKIQRAREHSATLRGIDAKQHPKEYRYVSNYVQDMLANQDNVDRAVDTLRGIFFVRYLGFVIKSGFVNLTQNVVMAAPRLSVDTKFAHTKLAKAMVDTRKAMTSKAAWLNKEITYPGLAPIEQQAVKQLHEEGATIDALLRELKGNMPGVGWSKHIKRAINASGIFMRIAEKFNRTSTGLAAFRVGYNEKFANLPEVERYAKSIDFAKEIIYDSHFVYGKHNLPAWARGGPVRKYFRSLYTFRSFTHNFLSMTGHMVKNQGWAGKVAVARSLRNIFLLGGLTSIPFFKAFSEMLYSVLGWDDDDAMTDIRKQLPQNWIRDLVVYGLPGAGGVDISGSLSIEMPTSWKDLAGIPYAVGEDTWNSYKSWKSGQRLRALSEMPFTPISVRNALRGLELYTSGQYTRSGRAISAPGKTEAQQLTATEMVEKSVLGFQPVKLSKGYAAYSALDKSRVFVENKKRELADKYVNALRRNDEKGKQDAMKSIQEWNQKASEAGKNYLMIDPIPSIKSRLRPSMLSIPKQQRQNAMNTYKAWE